MKYQQLTYVRRVFNEVRQRVLEFLHGEGNSISTIGRFLKFSKTTVCRWIAKLGSAYLHEVKNDESEYQVDELRTFVGSKKNESWIMYSIGKIKGVIASFYVGRRTKENLGKVIAPLLESNPKLICTDRLPIYGTLVPEEIHVVRKVRTNKIERRNVQLRLQLRRLNRRTICFSRSEKMLDCSFRMYLKYVRMGSENYDFGFL